MGKSAVLSSKSAMLGYEDISDWTGVGVMNLTNSNDRLRYSPAYINGKYIGCDRISQLKLHLHQQVF